MKIKQTPIHYGFLLVLGFFLTTSLFSGCSTEDDSTSSARDTEPPSSPVNLIAENTTLTSTDLQWSEATDNVGIFTYLVFKNDANLVATSSTERAITGLKPNTNYTFKVKAKDKAGNTSEFSNEVSVTTLSVEAELLHDSGNLESYIGNLIDSAPGASGNEYRAPTTVELNTWDLVIDAILDGNIEIAVQKAAEINYKITEFTDTGLDSQQVFYILEDNRLESKFWGTYVFSKTPERGQLVIQAPHIKYDLNTGKQAVYSFRNNLARALFISGTHRCNHQEKSSCSGSTTTCSAEGESYRISDMAHNVNSAFQRTSENLFDNIPNSVFVQLHGFGKKSEDPFVIMSNGTRDIPEEDFVVEIRDALLTEDSSLSFKIAHIDVDWSRLNGFTNTQGRFINNSSDPCAVSATSTSGRFIHIEQEKSKLREGPAQWEKMSNALKKVF
ncbi:fibronectin type III domain-containing protein [Salegentibacter mishustinae]|uniref:fibronectin type III domain-containing protein n=1 Tax=Salegentibacter mishustinae TaxID=270918 RepID=UPI0024921A1E|nr:fibronectin type III domain-containing protein [Salegentibacter mishustinae]